MPLFGQELFEQAEATKGLDEAYRRRGRIRSASPAPEGIDRMLKDNNVVALVGPTRPPAWLIDAVNGDQSPGGGAGWHLAAVAGYPHLTVPMGRCGAAGGPELHRPEMVGRDESSSLGYAYEQASHKSRRASCRRSRKRRHGAALRPSRPLGSSVEAALGFFLRRAAQARLRRASAAQRCIASASS